MSSTKKLFLEIITPAGKVYNNEVDMVIAPATEGTVGILPDHIPLFTKLKDGELKIKDSGKEEYFTIYGGFMDVNQYGKITIMTDGAKRSDEISEKAAAEAKTKAEKLLKEKTKLSEAEFRKIEANLKRAVLDLKAAQRRKKC